MQVVKILWCFFVILYIPNLYAKTVYYCETVGGRRGYYDRPCEMVLSKPPIKQATLFLQKDKIRQNFTNSDRLANINKFLESAQSLNLKDNKLAKKSKSTRKKLPKEFLRIKRCKNAEEKIKFIQEELKKENKEEKLIKLKRSLSRYKTIKKKNCVSESYEQKS